MRDSKWILVGFVWIFSICGECAAAAESGFYFSAGLGHTRERPRSNGTNFVVGTPPAVIAHVDPSQIDAGHGALAWSLGAGYRFNSHVAAELDYIDFGTTRITERYDDLGNPVPIPFPVSFDIRYSSKVTGPALSLVGSMPVGKRFSVFLRAGVLFADRQVKILQFNGFNETFGEKVWLGGLGVNWSLAGRWSVRAEYQRTGRLRQSLFFDRATELEQASLSLVFRH